MKRRPQKNIPPASSSPGVRVAAIGGGTGLSMLLHGLKH